MKIQKVNKNVNDNININQRPLTSLEEFILWLAKAQIIGVFFFATFGLWTIIKCYSDNILIDSLISGAGFALVFLFVQEKYIKIKKLTLAKIFFAISIIGGSFMCINSLLTYGTILSQELSFNLKELYGFIAYCFSIAIIIYYYKKLVWESKIRRTDIKLKFSEEIQKILPEKTIMTTITNNKDNTIQLVIMTENERNKMTEKEIREIIHQENERKD